MTRVSSADHVLVLLREQLQRMDRTRASRTGRTGTAQKGTQPPLVRLHEAASLDRLSDDEFRRTLVRAVLIEELGEGLANDPNFQVIVEDVFRILSESEEGQELISRAAQQLRSLP